MWLDVIGPIADMSNTTKQCQLRISFVFTLVFFLLFGVLFKSQRLGDKSMTMSDGGGREGEEGFTDTNLNRDTKTLLVLSSTV